MCLPTTLENKPAAPDPPPPAILPLISPRLRMPNYPLEFSIIIPLRNGEEYIPQAIESVLAQSYQWFNLLILENCSEDETPSIIRSYQDPRITIFSATSPLSMEANWGRILNLELAEYMTILGHDDLLYPDFLQNMVNIIQDKPEASLYHAHFHLINANGEIIRPCRSMPYQETAQEFLQARHRFERDSYGTGYVMKSADYKGIGGLPLFPNLICADDIAWYSLASLSVKVCSPHYLFAYRSHPQSAGQGVDLYSLYLASKNYLMILSQLNYLISADQAMLARNYIRITFNGRWHILLAQIIASGNKKLLEEYQLSKKRVLLEAAVDRLFPVYDVISWVLERVVYLPLPASLKKHLLVVIEHLGNITRSFRRKRWTYAN